MATEDEKRAWARAFGFDLETARRSGYGTRVRMEATRTRSEDGRLAASASYADTCDRVLDLVRADIRGEGLRLLSGNRHSSLDVHGSEWSDTEGQASTSYLRGTTLYMARPPHSAHEKGALRCTPKSHLQPWPSLDS